MEIKSYGFDEYSQEELKLRLMDSLNTNGLKDKLKVLLHNKAQVRSKLYAELSLRTQLKSDQPPKLVQKIIDSLFIEYLQERNLEFTLSVFLPESGLCSLSQVLGRDDLIHALHINSQVLSKIDGQEKSFLSQLLSSITRIFTKNVMDQQSQTNVEIDDLLHMKLRGIDQSVRYQAQEHDKRQIQMLEERLLSVQKELEERFQKQLEHQVTSYKQVELARMRMDEKKQFQMELERKKSIFEEQLIEAEQKFIQRIDTDRERLKERERDLEKNYLSLKQQMLDENHNAIFKERQMRNELELQAKQLEMERNQLQKRMEQVQNQVKELSEFKEKYTQKMEESMSQYKIDLNKEYSSLLSSVEIEKTRLEADRMMLTEKQKAVEKMFSKIHETEEEAARYKLEIQDLSATIKDLAKQNQELSYQNKDFQLQLLTQKGSSNLEFEISSLKRQLAAAEKSAEQRQVEYETLIKSMMNPQDDIQKELQSAKEGEVKWKSKCQDMVLKLDAEFAHTDELTKKLNQERLKNKEMERELADIRLVLHQSQSALVMQQSHPFPMYRRSTNSRYEDVDPLESRYSEITSKMEKNTIPSQIPHPSLFEYNRYEELGPNTPAKPISSYEPNQPMTSYEPNQPTLSDYSPTKREHQATPAEKVKSIKDALKEDILTKKDQAFLKGDGDNKVDTPVFKLKSPERPIIPVVEVKERSGRDDSDRIAKEHAEKEQVAREQAEKERLAREARQKEEDKRLDDLKKSKEKDQELQKLEEIGHDPLMKKYMELVKEKKVKDDSDHSEIKFDQGDTADEKRYFDLISSAQETSSGGPSW